MSKDLTLLEQAFIDVVAEHGQIGLREILEVPELRHLIKSNWELMKDYLSDSAYERRDEQSVDLAIAMVTCDLLSWHYVELDVERQLYLTEFGKSAVS